MHVVLVVCCVVCVVFTYSCYCMYVLYWQGRMTVADCQINNHSSINQGVRLNRAQHKKLLKLATGLLTAML